jgi:hypothetical protein
LKSVAQLQWHIYIYAKLSISFPKGMATPEAQSYLGLFVSTVVRVLIPQAALVAGFGYMAYEYGDEGETNTWPIQVSNIGTVMTFLDICLLPPALAILHQSNKIASRIAQMHKG